MRLEQTRPGTFSVTLKAHELSALLAGARMSLSVMSAEPTPSSAQARATLDGVLADFDAALARARGERPDHD